MKYDRWCVQVRTGYVKDGDWMVADWYGLHDTRRDAIASFSANPMMYDGYKQARRAGIVRVVRCAVVVEPVESEGDDGM